MNCPNCGENVAQGEAICPKCDFILDSSFLSGAAAPSDPAAPPPVAEERTNIGAPPTARPSGSSPRQTSTRPAMKSTTGQRPSIKSGPNPIPKTATGSHKPLTGSHKPMGTGSHKPVRSSPGLTARPANMPEPETEAATNIVPPKATGSRPAPRLAPRAPEPDEAGAASEDGVPTGKVPPREPVGPPRTYSGQSMVAPDQALDDFRGFIQELSVGDKVAFIGAALTVLTTFLPWKDTAAEGEILGLMSLGVVVFVAMIAVIFAIVVRVRQAVPQLHPLVPWLVQLVGTVFSGLWCVVYIGLSIDSRKTQALVGNFEVSVSAPAFGVFLALLCVGATLAGTLMGLKARAA